MTSMKKWW